jgi:hypothetical protein
VLSPLLVELCPPISPVEVELLEPSSSPVLLDPSPVVVPVVSSSLPWSAGVAQAMGG